MTPGRKPSADSQTYRVLGGNRPSQAIGLFVIADGPRSTDGANFEQRQIRFRSACTGSTRKGYSGTNRDCLERSAWGFDRVFSLVDDAIFGGDWSPNPTFICLREELRVRNRRPPTFSAPCDL